MKLNTVGVILLSCFSLGLWSVEVEPAPSVATAAYQKTMNDNSKKVGSKYDDYLKAMADANKDILKDLEGVKSDLSNTRKYTNLSILERADAITEIDEKIKAVIDGALGTLIVDSRNVDLPGRQVGKLSSKSLMSFLAINPKWKLGDKFIVFDTKEMVISIMEGDKVTYAARFTMDGQIVKWQDHRIDFTEFDGDRAIFRWTGVNPQDMTLK